MSVTPALQLRRGAVTQIDSERAQLQRVRVQLDGTDHARPAIHYPALLGALEVGERVLVNVQAAQLGLGSGGFDVVYARLEEPTLDAPLSVAPTSEQTGHLIRGNYAPWQHAGRAVEESVGRVHEPSSACAGVAVAACSLHSQLEPFLTGIENAALPLRIWYVQLAGGAVPLDYSDTVAAALASGRLAGAVAVAPCFAADAPDTFTAVDVHGALAWCAREKAQVVVLSIGPGILGSGSNLGHGSLALVAGLRAAHVLGASPLLLVPRVSDADARERHRGVSHHTETIRELLSDLPLIVPEAHDGAGMQLDPAWSSMGRSATDDPRFFATALHAGRQFVQAIG